MNMSQDHNSNNVQRSESFKIARNIQDELFNSFLGDNESTHCAVDNKICRANEKERQYIKKIQTIRQLEEEHKEVVDKVLALEVHLRQKYSAVLSKGDINVEPEQSQQYQQTPMNHPRPGPSGYNLRGSKRLRPE